MILTLGMICLKKLLKTENVDFTHTAVNIFIKDSKGKVPQKNCEIKPYTKADRVSTGNMSEGLTTDDCLAAALTAYVNKHDELFQFSEKEPNNTDANNFHSIDVKIQNFMPAGLYFQPQQQKHTHRAR